MKKKLLIFIFIFISGNSFSQKSKIIYVDEYYKVIDYKEYKKKFRTELFTVVGAKTDTAVFKKLRFKEYFGKLNFKKKSQLNKLFHARYSIDSSKVWLIHYADSLPNVKLMPKKSKIILLDSTLKPTGQTLRFKKYSRCNSFKIKNAYSSRHVFSYDEFRQIIPNELNKYKKIKDMEFLHFYGKNEGYPVEEDKIKWYKDESSIIQNTFSDGTDMYNTVVIYPNGDFYVSSYIKCHLSERRILKKKSFEKLREEFYKLYN